VPAAHRLLRRVNVAGVVFALAVLTLAEAGVRSFDLSDSMAAPSGAARALVDGLADGTLSGVVATTLETYVQGLVLAVVIGVALGVAIGSHRAIEQGTSVMVEFLRPVPAVALTPLAIFWFGTGASTIRFLVAYAAVWPVLVHTVYGIRGVDRRLYDVAATSGVTGLERIVRVSVPAALPGIVTGVRVSAALALTVCVTVEYFVGGRGVGGYLYDRQVAHRLDGLYAAAALTGLLGLAVDWVLRRAARRVVFWTGEDLASAR
jgi:NitT/TauT family transport system permease protein